MKNFLLPVALFFTITSVNAQTFSENFDNATVNSLVNNCWIVNGVSMTETVGEAITNRSIYTAPPTNPVVKTDVYTPVQTISVTNPNVSFDYRLTQSLSTNATRTIQVGFVTTTGLLVTTHTVVLGSQTGTGVLHYANTFTVVPGNYRIVFRISGSNGNGNVRLVIDNFIATGATVNIPANGGCTFTPIDESLLPVKMTSFTATLNNSNSKVNLAWTTATEINTSHFVVERSTDGNSFTDAGMVFAAGNSSSSLTYQFQDAVNNLGTSVIWYRLRSVDIDGKTEYSSTRIIRMSSNSDATAQITTYPNPVSRELRVTIPANWQNKMVTYEIIAVSGQLMTRRSSASSSQTETIAVQTLAPGTYLVRAICEGQALQQKIIKQ